MPSQKLNSVYRFSRILAVQRTPWLILLLFFVSARFVSADVPLLTTGSGSLIDRTEILGYSFTVNHEFTVTGLGKIDANGNGVLDDLVAPEIGLWNADTSEWITSALINEDMVFRDNMFVAPISPIDLPSGRYTVAAQYFDDEEPFTVDGEFDSPSAIVRNVDGQRANGGEFKLPTSTTINGFGPNLLIERPELLFTQPSTNSVTQRRDDDSASIRVEGIFDASIASSVEVRAVPMEGTVTNATSWQSATTVDSNFTGQIDIPTGGWFQVEARSMNEDQQIASNTVSRVGVGEVFVTAGQSNSANFGRRPLIPESDSVLAMDAEGHWIRAVDPQPIANGNGGSPWPLFGDRLVEELGVPIGVVSVGWGGTSVGLWLPGVEGPDSNGPLYNRLQQALERLGPNGARAVLWHQGETDSFLGTSREDYAAMLTQLVAHSRQDAGYDIPWGVAQAAYLPSTSTAAEALILGAQRDVIENDPLIFAGPLTDDLIGEAWRWDTIHFNKAGLRLHAERWVDAVLPLVVPEPASAPVLLVGMLLLTFHLRYPERRVRE